MAREFVNYVKGNPITNNTDKIKIDSHIGTWYVIDETSYKGDKVFLLEHEEYGDEAAFIAVDENGKVICEDIYDDFPNCLDELIEDLRNCPACDRETERQDMIYTRDCHGITYRLVCHDCYDKLMAKGYDGEYYTEADECINED